MKCSHCKGEFKREDVVINSRSISPKDGREIIYYYCNACSTERTKKYRQTKKGKQNVFQAVYRSIEKHQEKQNARMKLHWAIKSGKIVKPNCCSKCKEEKKLEAHHTDYSQPFKVKWLCKVCHKIIHRKEKLKGV